MRKPLVVVDGIKKTFPIDSGLFSSKKSVKAVNRVSFEIQEGETFSLVGESGCGKSTTGRLVTRLLTPDEGKIWINGEEISQMNETKLREVRKQVQMVFQDPYASPTDENPRCRGGAADHSFEAVCQGTGADCRRDAGSRRFEQLPRGKVRP